MWVADIFVDWSWLLDHPALLGEPQGRATQKVFDPDLDAQFLLYGDDEQVRHLRIVLNTDDKATADACLNKNIQRWVNSLEVASSIATRHFSTADTFGPEGSLTFVVIDGPGDEHSALPSMEIMRSISPKADLKTDKPETKYLTLPEAKLLIEATDIYTNCGVRDRAMLTMAIQTGVRSDEIRSLNMEDLRLDTPADIRIQSGKGRKARTLPLHDNTLVQVRHWLDIRGHGDGPLFPSTHKKKMSEDAFGLIVRSNVEKVRAKHLGFPKKDISPHTLRHTAAMLMVESGVGIETISLHLGHEDIRTTARYLHHNLNIKIRAMNRTTFPTTESALPPQSTQFVLSDSDREILKKLREND